jgi:hypothetical protein
LSDAIRYTKEPFVALSGQIAMTALAGNNSCPSKSRERYCKQIKRRIEGVHNLNVVLANVADQLQSSAKNSRRFERLRTQVENWYSGQRQVTSAQTSRNKASHVGSKTVAPQEPRSLNQLPLCTPYS